MSLSGMGFVPAVFTGPYGIQLVRQQNGLWRLLFPNTTPAGYTGVITWSPAGAAWIPDGTPDHTDIPEEDVLNEIEIALISFPQDGHICGGSFRIPHRPDHPRRVAACEKCQREVPMYDADVVGGKRIVAHVPTLKVAVAEEVAP